MVLSITDLPNEILSQIFEQVRTEDSYTLHHCLTVNWKFSLVARPIFYEHVCLHAVLDRKSALSRFLANTHASDLIRSFTIPVISDDVYGGEELEQIAKLISSFHRLETFVINLQDQSAYFLGKEDEDDSLSGHIPNSMFARILQALPFGVTNLELDLEYWNKESTDSHLCHEIGNLIPQLRTLRLHIHRVCKELLHRLSDDPNAVSRLRIATIKLYSKVRNWQFCVSEDMGSRWPSAFAEAIRYHYKRGAFPWLRHFYVCNTRYISTFSRGHHVYSRVRDVVTNTSLTVPARVVGQVYFLSEKPFIFRDELGRDLLGSAQDMNMFLERPINWTALPNGSRIPPTVAGCNDEESKLAAGEAMVIDPEATDHDEGVHDMMYHLWNREKLVGVPTLRATVTDGIDSESPPCEVLPAGYEFVQENSVWTVREIEGGEEGEGEGDEEGENVHVQ